MNIEDILSIIESDFAVPEGADYRKLVSELEVNLGSLDLTVRDKSYEILGVWCNRGILTDSELLTLGERIVSNLSVGLGELDTDNVFVRSFSALVLCEIIEADIAFTEGKCTGRKSFLTPELFKKWLDNHPRYQR